MGLEIIQNVEQLQKFCRDVSRLGWLALDTEFVREKTYYPNLCLIQVASDEQAVCIDTLAIDDLSALKELIYSKTITKVFHAASQDLEIFFNLYEDIPTPVFDTQIAASALGYGDQIGYAQLVNKICGISLDKSLSRTAWGKRPLAHKEIRYALDDVKYLTRIYQHLQKELARKKRDHWVVDEFMRISNIERYKIDANELWKLVKGVGKLESHQLMTLKFLAAWRNLQAIKENKPHQWIVRDKSLRALAISQPAQSKALQYIEELNAWQRSRYANALIHCIQKAKQAPKHEWPDANQVMPLNREQRKLLKRALQLIRERADELNIAPSLLATRNIVEKLIRGERKLRILQDWRQDLIGNDLIHLLESNPAN